MRNINPQLEKAIDCIDFIESSMNVILSPWQKSFLVTLFENPNDAVIVKKGRQIGASFVIQAYFLYLLKESTKKDLIYIAPSTAIANNCKNSTKLARVKTGIKHSIENNIEFFSYYSFEVEIRGKQISKTNSVIFLDEVLQFEYDFTTGIRKSMFYDFRQIINVCRYGANSADDIKTISLDATGEEKKLLLTNKSNLEKKWEEYERDILLLTGDIPQLF